MSDVNVPVSLVDVLNALAPSAEPFTKALTVPLSLLYAFVIRFVLTVLSVSYLLAVELFKLLPTAKLPPVLSAAPCASLLVS